MGKIKRFVLWEHSRETSVYVIFCLLIVAFIFLTPKAWFDNDERLATKTSKVFVKASDIPAGRSLEDGVRELSGDPNAVIIGSRQRVNANGEAVWEVEIR